MWCLTAENLPRLVFVLTAGAQSAVKHAVQIYTDAKWTIFVSTWCECEWCLWFNLAPEHTHSITPTVLLEYCNIHCIMFNATLQLNALAHITHGNTSMWSHWIPPVDHTGHLNTWWCLEITGYSTPHNIITHLRLLPDQPWLCWWGWLWFWRWVWHNGHAEGFGDVRTGRGSHRYDLPQLSSSMHVCCYQTLHTSVQYNNSICIIQYSTV